jgi:hypothetical protein
VLDNNPTIINYKNCTREKQLCKTIPFIGYLVIYFIYGFIVFPYIGYIYEVNWSSMIDFFEKEVIMGQLHKRFSNEQVKLLL